MPTKITPATKQLALQKLRDGLTVKEVADLTGVSVRTLQDWNRKQSGKSGIPGGKPAQTQGAAPSSTDAQKAQEQAQDGKTTLEFEDSPAPPEKRGIVDEAMRSLKGMLGIADKQETKTPPVVLSAKLDPRRQQFVDSASPTLALAAMALAAWLWGRIGSEYSALAPDEKAAQRIVEPLLRIYARHAQFMTDINPDVADVGASMFALVAYVHVSLDIYQRIKQEKEEEYGTGEWNVRDSRRYRAPAESTASHASSRHADVSGDGGANGSVNGANGRDTGGIDLAHLSDKEAAQHAALSRLSELDYQHRARRSGRPV